jgi:hypothetical protein
VEPRQRPESILRSARWAALALLAVACMFFIAPAAAPAHSRGAALSEASTLDLPAREGAFRDSIVGGGRRLARTFGSDESVQSFPVIGGESVEISSTHYSQADMQSVANVLGGLLHGAEMNTLSVYLATPEELAGTCGPGALACYAPAIGMMIISGVDGSSYGVPRDYTIAHEYGHHIANNRLNTPWRALDNGAKRWATYEGVCQGVRRHQLHPGDEDEHYWDNPGEGFAEATARLNFPGVQVPWGYNSLLRPNQTALAKLASDIVSPWTGPTSLTWHGSLWPQRPNPAQRRFSTPLDGEVRITLSGPEGSNYDLFVLGRKLRPSKRERLALKRGNKHKKRRARKAEVRRKVISRAASVGSSEQVTMNLCGQEAITVEVRRRSGSGQFAVSVTRP